MSALEEYRNNPWGMTCSNRDGTGFGGYGAFVPKVLADAAIAELEAENERPRVCCLCQHPVAFAGNTGAYCNAPETVEDEGAFAHPVDLLDPCHYAPSRWAERITP